MTGAADPIEERPRLRGEANREAVLRRVIAALERLLAAGRAFSAVTIEELAAEAGIARSTFYVHFRDRAALLRQTAEVVLEDLQDVATPLLEYGDAVTIEAVRSTMRAVMDAYRPHELLMQPVLAAAHQDPDVRAAYERAITRTAATVEAFIVTQRRHGRIRELGARETATALVRMVERTVTQEVMGLSAARRERIADALAQIVWHAVFVD
jgi:AcrR family transcriptional regulator